MSVALTGLKLCSLLLFVFNLKLYIVLHSITNVFYCSGVSINTYPLSFSFCEYSIRFSVYGVVKGVDIFVKFWNISVYVKEVKTFMELFFYFLSLCKRDKYIFGILEPFQFM